MVRLQLTGVARLLPVAGLVVAVALPAAVANAGTGAHARVGPAAVGAGPAASSASSTGSVAWSSYQDGSFTPLPAYPGSHNPQSPTADKEQSKVWWNAGSWWALMVTSGASPSVDIFRLLPDHSWQDTGVVVDPRGRSTGDALWTAGHLYVVSRAYASGAPTYVNRFEYDAIAQTYVRSIGPLPVSGSKTGVESASIARAADGALWVTFTHDSRVWVTHTTGGDDSRWVAPYRPGGDTDVAGDDVSDILATGSFVALLWSDQASHLIQFAIHRNTDPPTTWSVETLADSQEIADDHLSMRSLSSSDGRIYAVAKTSLDKLSSSSPSDPQFLLLTRSSTGVWSTSTVATLADDVTRPNVTIDSATGRLHVFYTVHSRSGGAIAGKSTTLGDAPQFPAGSGTTLLSWSGADINDVTTAKAPTGAASGILLLASDAVSGRYYHAEHVG